MKKLTKLTALLLAGLLSISVFAACNDGFDYTEEDEDEDDEKVTTTTTASTTTAAATTTTTAENADAPTPVTTEKKEDEDKPVTGAPVDEINPLPTQPDVMPSEIYQRLITAENAIVSAEFYENEWQCSLYKYGDLVEYYEYDYGQKISFTKYYNIATQTVYYEMDGKWYSMRDYFGTFADLMEEYGFGKDSIYFQDHNFDHYDSSFCRYDLKESLLDPQNGLLWGRLFYPYPGEDSECYNFQCQRVDQDNESYSFEVDSGYEVQLPDDVIAQ